MTFGNYCCNPQNHTSNPIDVGCGSPSDEIFRHLKGRVLPLECEKKDWKSIGNYYAIDVDGTLWSLRGEGNAQQYAGVNAFNKGLPKFGKYCQVDDSTDWSEIIQGEPELFLKNDGSLYTINSRKGLDINGSSFLRTGRSFPIEHSPRFSFNYQAPVTINNIEIYDTSFTPPGNQGLCYSKIKYSSNYKLKSGDTIRGTYPNPGYSQSGIIDIEVHYKISDNEFLTTSNLAFLNEVTTSGFPPGTTFQTSSLNLDENVSSFISSSDFESYNFDAPIARARISSKIEKYKILPSSSNDPNKTILDDIKFSRKPSLHVKYYKPSSSNIHTSDLDSDGFYHQCSSYLRENNISYYHKNDSPLEEVEALWKGQIDWIVAKPSGAGYFSAPTLTLIPQDNEIVTSGMSPSGLISVLPPTGIVTIDDKGTIVDIRISENPYVWNKPPQIKLEYENECIGSYDFTLETFDNQVKISSPLKLGSISQVGQGGSLDNRGLGFVWNKLDMGPNDEGAGLSIGNLPSSSMNGFDNYTIAIRCSLSPITGYNKLVGNIFVYNGSIHIYSDTSDISLGGFIGPGIINDIVLTRNNTDNIFSAYINNQLVASFPDNNFETIFNPSEPMVFFKETGQRFSEVGRVQKIRIWTNVVASSEISKALDYPDFVEASAVCEIIGNIQGFNVKASGDGYTHACTDDSKLVLVAQAHVDDLYVHGIPPQVTPTPFATPPQTPTSTPTPTITPTRTQTPSITPSITPTKTQTPTATPTYSPTPQVTNTPTLTRSPKESLTPTPSVTVTNSKTPAVTTSPTNSIPVSPTASVSSGPRIGSTPALNPTPTVTQTPPPSPSRFVGATSTPSATPTVSVSRTPSVTPSVTKTSTLSPTPYSPTPTTTQTPSNTFTPTITYSQTPSRTSNIDLNSITPTPSPTASPTLTISPSATSRIRKNKLKQWILADAELSPSTIEKIEFTRPLFSDDLLSIIKPFDTQDSGSQMTIDPNMGTLSPSGLFKKTWPSSRENIGLVLGRTMSVSGVEYTFMDSFDLNRSSYSNDINIYNGTLNYITAERPATIELNDRTKSVLTSAFSHPHFKEAFILGPGKRKEYLNSSNIDNTFDYSGSFFDYTGNSIINFNLYICMEIPVPDPPTMRAQELYMRIKSCLEYPDGIPVEYCSSINSECIIWSLFDDGYYLQVEDVSLTTEATYSVVWDVDRWSDPATWPPKPPLPSGAQKFCDIVAISGDRYLHECETITIRGSDDISRTYTNGAITSDNTKPMEYFPPWPGCGFSESPDVYVTPTGLVIERPDPPDYINTIIPQDASVEITMPSNGRKYHYKISDFMKTPGSIPRVDVSKKLPATKKETAKIYFPYNEFGEGAIAKLNAISGPSGYIICDSATLIKNNFYRCEPSGLIRTTGYDIPTRIGSNDHNFVGDVNFRNVFENKGLGTDNHLYTIANNRLYKDGGGVQFNLPGNTFVSPHVSTNYIISPPDYLPGTNATIDLNRLQPASTDPYYPLASSNENVLLTICPLSGNSNTRIGAGYYEDLEILDLGYGFIPESSVMSAEYVNCPNINNFISRSLSSDKIGLSCSVIPYNIDQLYSNALISQNNKFLLPSFSLSSPDYGYSKIIDDIDESYQDPLRRQLIISTNSIPGSPFVKVKYCCTVMENNSIGYKKIESIEFSEPVLSYEGPCCIYDPNNICNPYGNNNSAKLNIILSSRVIKNKEYDGEGNVDSLSYSPYYNFGDKVKRLWYISNIDILDGGFGYTVGEQLSIVDGDNNSKKLLNPTVVLKNTYTTFNGMAANVTVASVGSSGNITSLTIANSGEYYAVDPYPLYKFYYNDYDYTVSDGIAIKNRSIFEPFKYQTLETLPHFYVEDECKDKEKIANYVINNMDKIGPLIIPSYDIGVTIEANGSTPTVGCGPVISGVTISSLCGCIINEQDGKLFGGELQSLGEICADTSEYDDSYIIKLLDGSTLEGVKFKSFLWQDTESPDSMIRYNNYSIVSDISNIKGASNITNDGVWIIDENDQLKLIRIYSIGFLYAVKPMGICNHPLYNKNIKSIKGKIILSKDDQIYKIF